MSTLPYQSSKLDHIFDPVLDFHALYLERAKFQAGYRSLLPDTRLREYHTVRIGFGRQSGKSSYIARSASFNDLILCRGGEEVDKMRSRMEAFGRDFSVKIESWPLRSDIDGTLENVWVDDASILSRDGLDHIYSKLGSRCKRFILIG